LFEGTLCSAIFGGSSNTIKAFDGTTISFATIGGGTLHKIRSCSDYAGQTMNFIGGGDSNTILSSCGTGIATRQLCHASIGGGIANSISTYNTGGKSSKGCLLFIGGGFENRMQRNVLKNAIFGGYGNNFNSSVSCSNIIGNYGLAGTISNYTCVEQLSKTSGKFSIRHPDPTKKHTHNLVHSFVESPTAGDNIYRYEVATQNCEAIVSLPDYYKFLNCNDQVWITPKNHMGVAYGSVNTQQTEINIKSNCDGYYYVLLIGTRKDDAAKKAWRGVEVERIICRTKC
jgi:hypothetical protein